MHTEIIKAYTIDEAVEQILRKLEEDDDETTGSVRHNVIYFDGWDGLGASAVLRAVRQQLSDGREFSQIIHIDCSKWENRRAVQRALAVQLQLPAHVIEMFDAQDEEDDNDGVDQVLRHEMRKVSREIYEHVQKQLGQRFLVIFNNGSWEEIDLESFGFPLSGYSRNKALWSFQGGFRLYPRMKVDMALESKRASSTDVFLSATSINLSEYDFSQILRREAEEVAKGMIHTRGIDCPTAAADCFLYTMRLCGMGGHLIDYDLATHGCNYWICDGIIKHVFDSEDAAAEMLWLSRDALKHEMRLDADYHQSPQLPASPVVRRLQERMAYWTSPVYGSTLIKDQRGRIPKGMFQQYDMLRVLKLSACTFSLTSPPFLCCHNLRFLWLDHCLEEESSSTEDGEANEEDVRQCFQKLWVLDVRYSSSKFLSEKMMDFMAQLRELHVMEEEEFDMDTLQGRLHHIRKLRVTKSMTNCRKRAYLLSGKDKLEHLELSQNGGSMKSLSVESSSCSSLETVIIDGCISLEEISLKGWAKPKNLLLSGSFPDLYSLDLSGAAVKTLDLRTVMAPKLDELLLLDCVKLTAILWPAPPTDLGEGKGSGKRYLGKLRIDTTQKLEDDTGSNRSHAGCSWYICVRDTRLLQSLKLVKDYFSDNDAHLDISTTMPSSSLDADSSCKDVNTKLQMLQAEVHQQKFLTRSNDNYATKPDVAASGMQQQQQQHGDDSDDDSAVMFTCPPAPGVSSQGCYMHIEDHQQVMSRAARIDTTDDVASGSENNEITIPGFICPGVKILHVHDSLFITRIILLSASETKWDKLEWCQVERCPKLECVFSSSSDHFAFDSLRTIWASHLTNARYVMPKHRVAIPYFKGLTSLHLYYCPRLVHALPWTLAAFRFLEIFEIMWCGDLYSIFATSHDILGPSTVHALCKGILEFPRLKHFRLHELPKLYGILHIQSMNIYAPSLETVKIRGCWMLRKLPIVGGDRVVSCDCEKEWWDNLQWDDFVKRSSYKPIHSQHYKKTMNRGSPLR